MKQEHAETFALRALAWLVANDELLPVFLGASGLSTDDMKTQAGAPEFLISVLDFLAMDDAWVMQVCDALQQPYAALQQARQALPGGAQVHWT